jgi:uncharacterized protein (TIGR03086 family)
MDALTMLAQAGERTQKIVEQVSPGQLTGSTPCTEWDVRELLNHLIGGNAMFAMLAAGGTLPDMSGGMPDFVGDDPAASYRATFAQALDAWRALDPEATVALPFGPTPAPMAMGIHLMETTVHGWDVARATGQEAVIDDEHANATLALAQGMFAKGRRPVFGPEVPVPEDAPASDRLVGLLGRTS